MVAFALAGLWSGRVAVRARCRRRCAIALGCSRCLVLAYLIALAPVLAAGRPSFSSYMALADSAVHLIGAEYLIRHGQHFAHLDLRNSYGQFINDYYNTSYPSGADTLLGGSATLLGLPLIWAFQPFNAFMLASGVGPAWLLAKQFGLRGGWAGLAALTAVLPALVYAYELLGSVKEVTALALILSLGALVVCHERWLGAGARRALPFAILLAGGVSALGVAFGAWALVAALVLATRDRYSPSRRAAHAGRAAFDRLRGRRARARRADHLGATARLGGRRQQHRRDRQPRQPAQPAARQPGAGCLARRQLQARPAAGPRTSGHRHPDRSFSLPPHCSARCNCCADAPLRSPAGSR